MDPVNVIRAPSLKRGKPDERLSDRVSIEFFPAIDYLLLLVTVCGCLICQCEYRYVMRRGRRNLKCDPSSLELSAFKTKRNINRRKKNVIKNIVLRHQVRREMKIGSFLVAPCRRWQCGWLSYQQRNFRVMGVIEKLVNISANITFSQPTSSKLLHPWRELSNLEATRDTQDGFHLSILDDDAYPSRQLFTYKLLIQS